VGKTVVILGALDTKGPDFAFVRHQIESHGLTTVVVDFGVLGEPGFTPDVERDRVAEAGGESLANLRTGEHKDRAMQVMASGLAAIVRELYTAGRLDGIFSMGGGSGTALATAAMRMLPVGVPKVMVSTLGGGDVGAYSGDKDIVFIPSIVDVAGINRISRVVYTRAAGAICGMVLAEPQAQPGDRPLIAASMFGNSTPCVERARARLEATGYEVMIFHANGRGGRTMETLIREGAFVGCMDITTTELADEVCGGVLSAGPERCLAAAWIGVPTVLVPGCVDMANFWGIDTVPERYRGRTVYEWNPDVTLLRTDAEENARIGELIAAAANAARGPVTVLLPLKGVSMLDSPGGAFWDPIADGACFSALKAGLKPGIPVMELDCNINDPAFADQAADAMMELVCGAPT
jgi:uncharacterized protein (UPF0261 family)